MISIIIPAWNEEKYLPKLLDCLKRQTYKDYEIIVADAKSTDKTVKIAKKHGCRITQGGLPAVGRNNGAKIAKGSILLFLDADSMIKKDFIKYALDEIKKNNLDAAGSCLYPSTNKQIDKIILGIFNAWILATQYFYPNACGTGILCKKWLHKKISGFDETIKLGEDMDYVRMAGKFGKFGIIKNSKIIYSMRRYNKEGRFKVSFKILLSLFYRIFFGEIRSNIFKYDLRYRK